MARDEFLRTIVEVLAKRAGQQCSNPSCGGPTSGAHTLSDKAIIVGVASHIAAASPGGPRYDPSMTLEQRTAPENGIWLCQTCAKLVDSDTQRFSTAVLHQWKARAELATQWAVEGSRKQIAGASSIQVRITDWHIWRERGNQPGDQVINVDIWGSGDIRYCCVLRLMQIGDLEEQLHTVRVEWRHESKINLADAYAVLHDVTLPPKQWVTFAVDYGLHRDTAMVYEESNSIWLSAIKASDALRVEWKLADIDHAATLRVI